MKSIMISIRPEWCEKIASGKKTIEVRKTKPKLETPFNCYIYCTYGRGLIERYDSGYPNMLLDEKVDSKHIWGNCCNGTVIGEFVCDDVFEIKIFDNKSIRNWNFYNLADACIPYDDLAEYIGANKTGYGWHIAELKIYDKPRELGEFRKPCVYGDKDISCFLCDKSAYRPDMHIDCFNFCNKAPQSWFYVEENTDE